MTATTGDSNPLRQTVLGSRRFSNYLWAAVCSIGGVGFLLAGLSSYLHINLLLVSDTSVLQFVPQGLALTFYGVIGSAIATYQWLVTYWDVGGGYNQFDRETGDIEIFRWGFPGKNRRIEIRCRTEDVQSIKADIKDGLNPKRALYLALSDRRQIPLTRVGEPVALSELENQGAALARFLAVPLEGL